MSLERPFTTDRLWAFFCLACGITWACDLPMVLASWRGIPHSAYALPLAGLGALGPALAALVLSPSGQRSNSFGPWRTPFVWPLVALFVPMAINLVATAVHFLLGGEPLPWLRAPTNPEQWAALVFFSLGEEFGWRGYAQPVATRRYGLVAGALIVGVVWTVWHLGMLLIDGANLSVVERLASSLPTYVLYSLLFAWFATRSGGSIACALALHAGAHLDNSAHVPASYAIWHGARLFMLVALALAAACSLRRSKPVGEASRAHC